MICHQLGYPGAVRATTRSYFTYKTSSSPSQHIRAVFNNVDCTGLEESIFDCLDIFGMPLDISTLDSCPSLRTAGVICNGQFFTSTISVFCLEVYRYQIFLFPDIRYSLFKKKPILIADLIYITSCFSHVLHIKFIVNNNKITTN